jgi:hypothetical protein
VATLAPDPQHCAFALRLLCVSCRYTSNLISAGSREVIRFLVQHKMVSQPLTPQPAAYSPTFRCSARSLSTCEVCAFVTVPTPLVPCLSGGRDRDDCGWRRGGLLQVPGTTLHWRLPSGRGHAAQEGKTRCEHTHLCPRTRALPTHTCTCTHVRAHTHAHLRESTRTHAHAQEHMHACIRAHAHIGARTHTHVHAHMKCIALPTWDCVAFPLENPCLGLTP